MELIKSVHNPLVKYLQKLNRRKFREQEGRFLVEGIRFVEEALKSGWPVDKLIYSPDLLKSRRGADLLAAAAGENVKKVEVDQKIINVLASTETPQGVMALCLTAKWRVSDLAGARRNGKDKKDALVVVVDGVADPGNLGTIIRSADAFGAEGVVLMKGTVDLYNDKTMRSTMGSFFHLPVVSSAGVEELRGLLSEGGFGLLVGVPKGGVPVDRLDLGRPLALVVGSEAAGPSGELLSLPHEKVTIPMPGRAESLNAAVAASLLMYEIVRQRNSQP
ncbi:MAG: RNA methyltransferase [Firmicutes bacterium]|nr:RNA methyltransferase [Bacillota bacterium]